MFTIRKLVTVLTLICIIHQTLACYVIETLSKKDALEIASNFSLSIADEVEKPEAASDIILKGSSNIIECRKYSQLFLNFLNVSLMVIVLSHFQSAWKMNYKKYTYHG